MKGICIHNGTVITGFMIMENCAVLIEDGIPVENAVEMATINPARILALERRGALIPGYKADVTVFSKNFEVLASIVSGKFIKEFS